MNTPVSFSIAKLLKEKEFDGLCEWAYQSGKLVHDSRNKEHKNWNKEKHVDCTAPTIAEVVMWLYEKHEIWIEVTMGYNYKSIWYDYHIVSKSCGSLANDDESEFNSPSEAYEAAIKYTLNNLI